MLPELSRTIILEHLHHESTPQSHAQIDVNLNHFSRLDHPLSFSFFLLFSTHDGVEHTINLAPILFKVSHEVHKCVGNQNTNLIFNMRQVVAPFSLLALKSGPNVCQLSLFLFLVPTPLPCPIRICSCLSSSSSPVALFIHQVYPLMRHEVHEYSAGEHL